MEYNIPIKEMVSGERYEGFYILNDPVQRTSSNGKPYLAAKISDRTGTMDLKMWDCTSPFRDDDAGAVIKVRGSTSEFKGSIQFTAEQIRLAQDGDIYDIANLVPAAPIDVGTTLTEMTDLINTIVRPEMREMCLYILDGYRDAYATYPAAKSVHHSFLHGLLMHTASMMQLADKICEVYGDILDRDLLIAGAFLHDIGKFEEFDLTKLGLVKEYSFKGNLIGHLALGYRLVAEMCDRFGVPAELSVMLQHMILSHHGEPEHGAVIVPKTIEAEVLHMIDLIDSKAETYREKKDEMQPGTFSENIFALGKRIYKPFV